MFLWRNKQNYPLIITKYPPYLLLEKEHPYSQTLHIIVPLSHLYKRCSTEQVIIMPVEKKGKARTLKGQRDLVSYLTISDFDSRWVLKWAKVLARINKVSLHQ